MNPESLFEVAFKLACLGFTTLAGWLWSGVVDDMKAVKKDVSDLNISFQKEIANITKDHSDHKVYIEREFEKRETIQLSLSRIHDRLDKIFDLMQENNS